MNIAQTALTVISAQDAPWRSDWLWGCPLIMVTVTVHTLGLSYTSHKAILIGNKMQQRGRPRVAFAFVISAITLLATLLHGIEAAIWGEAYLALGALSRTRSAMLYSLSALTTYAHHNLYLEDHWQLLGAIEALNGWLLFGLSTAFLFLLIQELSPSLRDKSE
jgi:hypothetical protein